MPILQHKLVMKSIEALHDEALALVPDPASDRGVTAPPAVLHAATPRQDTPINLPKNTSADASADTSADTAQKTASDDDIMARIDQLLKKLDEDDDLAIAPPPVEGPQFEVPRPDTEHMTGDAGHTETANNITTDNLANPDSHVLSDAADHAVENAILDVAVDGVAEDTAGKPFGETDNAATDIVSDNLFVDDQPGKTAADDQTQALADIAAAIYQARQQAVDTVVADASQNNTAPFDMNALSATVADEVRRTVSAVITAELPKMVRDAVGEAIRTLPADARHQPAPTTGIRSAAKKGTARKTAAIKKAVAKKAGTKKAGVKKPAAKKAAGKTTPKNKLSSKKVGAKKAATKKATAKKTAKST